MPRDTYPPTTAGGRMIYEFPRVETGEIIRDIDRMLMQKGRSFENLDYVYVVDRDNVLQGVVSIRELLSVSDKNVNIEEVMRKTFVVVHPSTKQERIVYLALSHNLKAIPVVDRRRVLLGIVPYEAILQIFNEEVREDLFKIGGIFHRVGTEYTTITSPASVMIKRRLPWLMIGVMGGSVTAYIVSSFESMLGMLITLAAFIPVLAYLSDAAGTQSETLVVRSIALDPELSLKSYFVREFKVAISLGLACGLFLSVIAMIGWNNNILGLIVGISMFLSIFSAIVVSTSLPFLLQKIKLDPAIVAGPFATMVSDIITIMIYFGVANLSLSYFGL